MAPPSWPLIGSLLEHFMVLSLLSVGGAITTAPDMHRWLVVEDRLMGDAQFASSIAIAQAAPGPNLLFVPLLGFQAAGLVGAVAALIGILLPSTTLSLVAARWGHARADWRGVRAFKVGMAPISVALIASTGWLLAAPLGDWRSWLLTACAAWLVWRTRLHLLAIMATGAALGMLGWV